MNEEKKLLTERDVSYYQKILKKQVHATYAKFSNTNDHAFIFNYDDRDKMNNNDLDKLAIPTKLLRQLLDYKSTTYTEEEIEIAVYLIMLETPYLEEKEALSTESLIIMDHDSILTNLEQNYENFKTIADSLFSFFTTSNKLDSLIDIINETISLVNSKKKVFKEVLQEVNVEHKLSLLDELTDIINKEDTSLLIKQLALNFVFSGLIPVNKNFIKATFSDGNSNFKFTDFDWKTANYLLLDHLPKGTLTEVNIFDYQNNPDLNKWAQFSMVYHLTCLIINSFNDNLEPVRCDEQNFQDWNDILDKWKSDRVLTTLLFNDYSFTNNKSIDDFVCKKRTHLSDKQLSAKTKIVTSESKLTSYIGEDIFNDLIKQYYNYKFNSVSLNIKEDLEDKSKIVIKSMLSRSVMFYLTFLKNKFRLKHFKDLFKRTEDYLKYNDILEEILTNLDAWSQDFSSNYTKLIQTTLKVLMKYIKNDYYSHLDLKDNQETIIYKSMFERGNKSAFPFSTTYTVSKVNSDLLTDFAVKIKSKEPNELLIYIGNVLSGSYYDKTNSKVKILKILRNPEDYDFEDVLISIILRATLYQTTGVSRLHNSKFPIYDAPDKLYSDLHTESKINRERPIVFNTKVNVDSFVWEKLLKEFYNRPENVKKTQWTPYSVQSSLGFHSMFQNKKDDLILKILTDRNGHNFDYLQKYEDYETSPKEADTSRDKVEHIFGENNDINEKISAFAGDVSEFDTSFDKFDLLNYAIGISLIFNNDDTIINHYLLSLIPHFNVPVTHRGQKYLTYIEGLRSGLSNTSTAGDSKCENVEHMIFLDNGLNIIEYIDNWTTASSNYYKEIFSYLSLPEELADFNASLICVWPFQHASDDILVVLPYGDQYSEYSKYFNLKLSETKDSANFSGVIDYLQIYHDSSSIINIIVRMILSPYLIDKASWEARDYKPILNGEREYSFEDIKHLTVKMGDIDLNSIINNLESLKFGNFSHWLNFKREIIEFIPDITHKSNWDLFSALLINPEFIKGRSIGKFLNPEMTKNVPKIIDFLGLIARCYNSSLIIPAFWSNSLATDYVKKLMVEFLPNLGNNVKTVTSQEIRSSVELFINNLTNTLKLVNNMTESNISISDLNLPYNFSEELINSLVDLNIEEDPSMASYGVPPIHNPESLDHLSAMVLNFLIIMADT